jgi:hypothetical protein
VATSRRFAEYANHGTIATRTARVSGAAGSRPAAWVADTAYFFPRSTIRTFNFSGHIAVNDRLSIYPRSAHEPPHTVGART